MESYTETANFISGKDHTHTMYVSFELQNLNAQFYKRIYKSQRFISNMKRYKRLNIIKTNKILLN